MDVFLSILKGKKAHRIQCSANPYPGTPTMPNQKFWVLKKTWGDTDHTQVIKCPGAPEAEQLEGPGVRAATSVGLSEPQPGMRNKRPESWLPGKDSPRTTVRTTINQDVSTRHSRATPLQLLLLMKY